MSGKISEYNIEALVIGDDDWFDISVDTGSGFESRKIKGSTMKALITGGLNLATSDLVQTDGERTYDFTDKDKLVFVTDKGGAIDFRAFVNLFERTTFLKSIVEQGVQVVTTNDSISSNISVLFASSISGAITLTMPNPSAVVAGQRFRIVCQTLPNETITLVQNSSETINGDASVVFDIDYSSADFVFDGSNWVMVKNRGRVNGWESYFNSGYADTTHLALPPNTDTQIEPLGASVEIINDYKPSDIEQFIEDNKILGKLGDSLAIQISFIAEPFSNDQWLDFWLDIGGSIGEIYRHTFIFPKGSGVERNVVYSLSNVYQLDTWVANGAKMMARTNNNMELTNFRINITRTSKAN